MKYFWTVNKSLFTSIEELNHFLKNSLNIVPSSFLKKFSQYVFTASCFAFLIVRTLENIKVKHRIAN